MIKRCGTLSRVFKGILLLLPLLLFPSCKTEPNVWKIGFIGPMSGGYANYGKLQVQGIQLAIQEFRARYGKIGGKDIQLVVENSAAGRAKEAARKLIQDERIIGLVGPLFSTDALLIADDFQAARIPMLAMGTHPDIAEKGDYIFRTTACDTLIADSLARHFFHKSQITGIGIVHDAENAFSQTLAGLVQKDYEGLGGKVLANIGVRANTADFSPYLEELAAFSPSAIFLTLYPIEFAEFLAQLRRDPRYKETPIIGGDAIINQAFLDRAGYMAEGIVTATDAPVFSEETRYFEAMYRMNFGTKPEVFATYIYDSTMILLQAMRRDYQTWGEINASILRQEISQTRYTGASGHIAFSENGDAKKDVGIFQVRAGSFVQKETYAFSYGRMHIAHR